MRKTTELRAIIRKRKFKTRNGEVRESVTYELYIPHTIAKQINLRKGDVFIVKELSENRLVIERKT